MKDLLIIAPMTMTVEMQHMVQVASRGYYVEMAQSWDAQRVYQNRRILFCLDLDAMGHCLDVLLHLKKLYENAKEEALHGSFGAIFVRSPHDLHTKRASQDVIGLVNQMGCRLMGHSVVEAVRGLKNFATWQKTVPKSLEQIRDDLCIKQIHRLMSFRIEPVVNKRLLVLHASSHATSNTLMLWEKIEADINTPNIQTFHVENGSIVDCKGCDFTTCIHYAKQKSCFYGGQVIREILPAIEESDVVVWICPNYNDALSANLTALINRLTVLYRRINFYNKRVFAVVVSGNSGSDSVTNQLLGALNINKGFQLPPHFALMEIANDPGSILNVEGIDAKAKAFAEQINIELK